MRRAFDKFGIPLDEALALAGRMADYRSVDLIGVHQHIGSQITKLPPFTRSALCSRSRTMAQLSPLTMTSAGLGRAL